MTILFQTQRPGTLRKFALDHDAQFFSFGLVPGATPPEPPPGAPRRRFATPPHRGDPTCPGVPATKPTSADP